MHSFFTALVAYLACDGMAAERMLDPDEALTCAKSYEAVKVSFLSDEERRALKDGPEARAEALRAGYRRYSAWLQSNSGEVAGLRTSLRAEMANRIE